MRAETDLRRRVAALADRLRDASKRDVAVLTVLAVAAVSVVSLGVANGDANDVVAAGAGDVRPATAPAYDTDRDAMRVDVYDPLGERPDAPGEQDMVAAVSQEVDAYEQRQAAEAAATERGAIWDRLADCESGDWQNGQPIPGTRRWDYGLTFSHGDIFEGGVNFHPQTWDAYRDPGMPSHAGQATREQQIEIAEEVLADQGWAAWPVCSRKLGYR